MVMVNETTIVTARRKALLEGQPALESLPDELFEQLATELREEAFPADAPVVAEGEAGDRIYVIAEGHAAVSARGPEGPLPLAVLQPGELFGEVALLSRVAVRTATVTAVTPLLVLSLDAARFAAILAAYPEARAAYLAAAEALEIIYFLKAASPFSTLDPPHLRDLAARLRRRPVAAGETIVRQGEPGRNCFLLREGRVEVLVADVRASEGGKAGVRRVAELGPGEIFGEVELLAGGSRCATVRATTAGEVLELHRFDLLAVINEDSTVRDRMRALLRQRARPRRLPGVVAQQRQVASGETITTLQDPARGASHRLSPQGRFVWERLDGLFTLEDLERASRQEFGAVEQDAIVEIVAGLAAAGFITGGTVATAPRGGDRPTLARRLGQVLRRVVGRVARR